ncbi:MAG: hypothetical protein ACR2KI_04705 [Candidatus Limnocylindria bacterium]
MDAVLLMMAIAGLFFIGLVVAVSAIVHIERRRAAADRQADGRGSRRERGAR